MVVFTQIKGNNLINKKQIEDNDKNYHLNHPKENKKK